MTKKVVNSSFNYIYEPRWKHRTEAVVIKITNKYGFYLLSIEVISRELKVTTRTLQRNLKKENTSFKTIVSLVRLEMMGTLKAKGLSDSSICEKIGLTSVANLKRLIKKQQ